MNELGFVLSGLFVGLIVGLTGVGGGSLMTPILIFFFDIKPYLAVGTDLLFAACTKGAGTLNMARRRMVPWRVVGILCAGILPACVLTLWALNHLGPAEDSVQQIMKATLGLALLLTSAAMLYKAIKGKTAPKVVPESELQLATQSRHWAMPVAFGAVIGVLVTLTSVGAGAIGVSVLMVLYPRLPIARIVAIDIAYAVPLTLLAGLGHASMGSVDWQMLGYLLTGSLPGIWLGSQLVHKAPERLIRSVISVLLAWAGSKLVFL